jgi:formylglycine-generating enzyme required for sulfatase activity
MSPAHNPLGLRFLDIPGKTVEFEDGRTATVEPFAISKRAVTVALFEAFEKATGYVTAAERSEAAKVFRVNELIEHMSPAERLQAPAYCVSYLDALAFCDWAEVRPPTDAEWLAASLIDEHVYDLDEGEPCPWWDAARRRLIRDNMPETLEFAGWEWTSTRLPNGLVTRRRGPKYFRTIRGQTDPRNNRSFGKPEEWDLFASFRVCK